MDHLSRKPFPVFHHTFFSETALFSSICIYLPESIVCQKPWLQLSLIHFINFSMHSFYIYTINKWSINKVGHAACLNFTLEEDIKNATKLLVLVFDWNSQTPHILQHPFSSHISVEYLEGWQTWMGTGEYSGHGALQGTVNSLSFLVQCTARSGTTYILVLH